MYSMPERQVNWINCKRVTNTFVSCLVILSVIVGAIADNSSVSAESPPQLVAHITYPANVKTNQQKLDALESLIQQYIKYYNEVGTQYRVGLIDKEQWYVFAHRPSWLGGNVFDQYLLPLLQERNNLRQLVLDEYCQANNIDWPRITFEQRHELSLNIYGDKAIIREQPTRATIDLLDKLKAVDISTLSGALPPDPYEDFENDYNETDPTNDLSAATTQITADGIDTWHNTYYFVKDFGADHFDALDVLFAIQATSDCTNNYENFAMGFSNESGEDWYDWSSTEPSASWWSTWNSNSIELSRGPETAYDYMGSASFDTWYYCRLVREAGNTNITLYIYSDASRETLLDTLSIAGLSTDKWRYCYGGVNAETGSGERYFYGYIKDMDLQEGGGVVAPTVTTDAASDVEDTTATLNGTVDDDGGDTIDYYGFVWDDDSDEGDPGDADPSGPPGTWENGWKSDVGDYGEAAFDHAVAGLPTGTTIYYRAAAHNSEGWSYGDAQTFLTKPAAPTNVAATDGDHTDKVVVTWDKSTGATGYKVYRNGGLIDTIGDVATYDDVGATAAVIGNSGVATASDGTSTAHVTLSLAGEATATTSYTYKLRATNGSGDSDDSDTDDGYRGVGAITYQWQVDDGGGYDNIAGGTTDPYNYSGAPAPTVTPGDATASDGTSADHVTLTVIGESGNNGATYDYRCVVSASGASNSPQNSTTDTGYRGTEALTYQWYRSFADADEDYTALDGGTTDPYNDAGGPVDPDGRWYYCEVSMGAVTEDTTHNRGYRSASGGGTGEDVFFPIPLPLFGSIKRRRKELALKGA